MSLPTSLVGDCGDLDDECRRPTGSDNSGWSSSGSTAALDAEHGTTANDDVIGLYTCMWHARFRDSFVFIYSKKKLWRTYNVKTKIKIVWNFTTITGHKNAANTTLQHKHAHKKRKTNYGQNQYCRSTRASAFINCFKEVALVTVDGKLFQHETRRWKKSWILVLLTLLKIVLSVLISLSFWDGDCNLCVSFFLSFFRAAVRAFSLACPANYCFITLCILSFLANKRERERENYSDELQYDRRNWNVKITYRFG